MTIRAWRTQSTELPTSLAAIADPSGIRSQIMIFNEVGSGVVVRVYRVFYWYGYQPFNESPAALYVRRVASYDASAGYGSVTPVLTTPGSWVIPPTAREPNTVLTPGVSILSNTVVTDGGVFRSIYTPSGPARLEKLAMSSFYTELPAATLWSVETNGDLEPIVVREGEGMDVAAGSSIGQATQPSVEIEFTVEG